MKARVLKEFRDKDNFAKVYEAGAIIDLSAERIRDLKGLGLVAEIRERNTKKTSDK